MLGSELLGVATGLILVYIVFSLILTATRETAEAWLKSRSQNLEQGLMEIFRSGGTVNQKQVEAFYNHPLVSSLYQGSTYGEAKAKKDLPSYIPARNFSAAVMDVVRGASGAVSDLKALRTQLANDKSTIAQAVVQAIDAGGSELDKARAELEAWYDSVMDRVSGWYKRRIQKIMFVVALLLAVGLNVNSVIIAQALYSDDMLRERVEQLALHVEVSEPAKAKSGAAGSQAAAKTGSSPERQAATNAAETDGAANRPAAPSASRIDCSTLGKTGEGARPEHFDACVRALDQRLRATGLPVGWNRLGADRVYAYVGCSPAQPCGVARSVGAFFTGLYGLALLLIGYVATAAALTLGAPFWFDVLNKVMVIRSTVKPREKSQEEGSEDRRPTRR